MTDAAVRPRTGAVLLTLGAAQFLMTLDSSVMNVAIATVAADVGTGIDGIQTAITLYTLVMAMLMIPGGRIGTLIGRKKAFAIGCAVYGVGSTTTALAPNLAVLILGWSVLEGIGAALILPAVVALVAGSVPPVGRPRAYGLIMAAGAVAVAVGPLVGGIATTYFSWRWVFAGEVVLVLLILLATRVLGDVPKEDGARLDVVGAVLSAAGLGLAVFGVLRSSVWGWVVPKEGVPAVLGLSPTIVLLLLGILVLWFFVLWEHHVVAAGRQPLVRLEMFANRQLTGGLIMFFFQFLVQAGLFFTIPLYLSVALGLSAIDTGLRIMPLSITLLLAAAGIPRLFPHASPRLVTRAGFLAMTAGIVALLTSMDAGAGAQIVTVPLLLAGLGIGALASQLGSVTVSAVPDHESSEVGGLQNTATNLGASLGTALAGSLLIAMLTASFLTGIEENPDVPPAVSAAAEVELASGIPFLSDADLAAALARSDASPELTSAVLAENRQARLDALTTALAALALLALVGLFLTTRVPTTQPGAARPQRPAGEDRAAA
ncbi:MFS transporter [Cellulomonas sp. S1-8]|uniref:MFS transporter n=1 Tax=Cellulomonas sp. S1-8 TaxID=2904790 RepID=UPI002243382E|nr:MFS transporter [Cellulomonas sp. S1-8]UZN01569.1 MFS transporter [Cellulomonas sp. S1-8]